MPDGERKKEETDMEDPLIRWSCIGILILLMAVLSSVRAANVEEDREPKYITILTGYLVLVLLVTGWLTGLEAEGRVWWQQVLLCGGVMLAALTFGCTLPARLAKRKTEKIAARSEWFVKILSVIACPVTVFIELIFRAVCRIGGISPGEMEENVTEEEIMSMVNEGYEQGVLEDSEAEMISNIMELDGKEVQDIMTHRKKIIGIDAEMSIEEALRFMLGQSYSRYPLYEEDIDNIVGILHLKDLTKCYVNEEDENRTLMDIARKPYFVPETQDIDDLFHQMQARKIHMAIAIDEYGQTAGLVAMEDILEEIVGNILDEYDVDEKFIIRQGEGRFIIKGLTDLEEVEEALAITVKEEEYDTLNGLLISLMGRIPADGEKTAVSYGGYVFHILDVKDKTIRYVRAVKEQTEESEE